MGLERHEGHWRWVGGPVPPGIEAITLGALIVVRRRSAGSAWLLRHELAHVEQWRRLGAIGFLRSYLGAYFRGRIRGFNHKEAYLRIPLEEEARRLAQQAEST
jgi:hypothetical protein